MSRTAFTEAAPRIADRLIDQIAIEIPIGIGTASEQVGDVNPSLPSSRRCRDEAGRWTTGHGDLDLLASLDSPHEIRRMLAELSKPDRSHLDKIAHVLLLRAGISTCRICV